MKVKTQQVALSKLHLNNGQIEGVPKNPRFIKDEKFETLKKSIQDDPEMLELREIIAYDNGGELVIVGGNMRYRAMKELGFKDAPVKILPQETAPEKIRAFIIKDNVAYGQNDWDILANEWDVDELTDWGLECDFLSEIPMEEDKEEDKELPKDLSDEVETSFRIEVECANEEEQEQLYNRFVEEGLTCRILTL